MKELYSQDGLTCSYENSKVTFSGGKHGSHYIYAASEERILAHWQGYLEANGFEYRDTHGYEAGDDLEVFVNQGWRPALVLGVDGDQMIFEYEMPAGTTALQVSSRHKGFYDNRSVAYASCPKRWIEAIRRGEGDWTGNGQTGHRAFPSK